MLDTDCIYNAAILMRTHGSINTPRPEHAWITAADHPNVNQYLTKLCPVGPAFTRNLDKAEQTNSNLYRSAGVAGLLFNHWRPTDHHGDHTSQPHAVVA